MKVVLTTKSLKIWQVLHSKESHLFVLMLPLLSRGEIIQ